MFTTDPEQYRQSLNCTAKFQLESSVFSGKANTVVTFKGDKGQLKIASD